MAMPIPADSRFEKDCAEEGLNFCGDVLWHCSFHGIGRFKQWVDKQGGNDMHLCGSMVASPAMQTNAK